MSTVTLKVTKTDSEMLEKTAHKVSVNGEEWFYMPFWFNKQGDGIYVQYPFHELPNHIKEFLMTEHSLDSIKPNNYD